MDIEQAKNQLFNTTAELIGANDDIEIIEGLLKHSDFQETLAREREEDKSLLQKLNSWMSGEGKWKKLPYWLFRTQILRPQLIKMSVTHIRYKAYTAKSIARVVDMHYGFNLNNIEPSVWSSLHALVTSA
jgi:hypothetical protein